MKSKYIVGIDEAGRGPLAGPVAVGVVKTPGSFDWESKLPGVTDSKVLSPEQRTALFRQARELRHHRELDFTVAQVGASVIDSDGITVAVTRAMLRCLHRLQIEPEDTHILLDGSLYAPPRFSQDTIVKGDLTEPAIGLASIVAKVTRDIYMERIARRYTNYGFEIHKGYGTKAHRAVIARLGKCPIHRATYCRFYTEN